MCTYRSFFLSDPFVKSQTLYMRERVYASVFFFHEDDSHSLTNPLLWDEHMCAIPTLADSGFYFLSGYLTRHICSRI